MLNILKCNNIIIDQFCRICLDMLNLNIKILLNQSKREYK